MTPNMRDFLIVVGGAAIFAIIVQLMACSMEPLTAEEKFLREQQRVADIVWCKRDAQCVLVCNRLPGSRPNDLRDCRPSMGRVR